MNINDFERHIENKVRLLLENFPAVAIIGVRQAGKTSLAKRVCPDWYYADLEAAADYDLISQDATFFFEQHPQHVIIDEAQEYPPLFQVLRGVIDAKRKQKGRFILTGSSSLDLIKGISESLAGRIAIVELDTFKVSEYFQKPLSPFYDLFESTLAKENLVDGPAPLTREQVQHLWLKGGYPEPLLNGNNVFYQQWIENYFQTYINRDIAKLFPRLNRLAYRRFSMMLGKLSGTIINRSDLGRAIEVSQTTIKEYLDIAEGTFIWRQLMSYENDITKSIVKMSKGYIRDSAILHYFLKVQTLDELLTHPQVGHSFEAFVIEELVKGLRATLVTNWDVHYYRTRAGAEVDLIISGPFGVLPIEIKFGSTVLRKSLKSLNDFVEKHHLPFGMVINQSEEVRWLTPKIIQMPVMWL